MNVDSGGGPTSSEVAQAIRGRGCRLSESETFADLEDYHRNRGWKKRTSGAGEQGHLQERKEQGSQIRGNTQDEEDMHSGRLLEKPEVDYMNYGHIYELEDLKMRASFCKDCLEKKRI